MRTATAVSTAISRQPTTGAVTGAVTPTVTTMGRWRHHRVRGCLLVLASSLLASMLLLNNFGLAIILGWAVVGLILLASSVISRALFYVLVIPTTMPGAFFWKNKGFEEHARDIGLANMPQVGVAPLRHYPK